MGASSTTRRGNGAGKGKSWGGPAKGFVRNDTPAHASFEVGNRISHLPTNARAELRRQRAAEMEDAIYDLATSGEREETRLSAATKLHAIYEGTPVARTVTFTANELSDLDDAALDARRAELEARLRGVAGGNPAPEVGKPH